MYLQMQIDVYKGHTNGFTNGNGTSNYLLKLKTMCATVQIRRLTFLATLVALHFTPVSK